VNDAFVMGVYGKDQQVGDKVKPLVDGYATFAKMLGLELDATGLGLGIRPQRFATAVAVGVVKCLPVEQPGAFEASSAEALQATP
jgi:peroxiredoxin (alkyl hydroperoxide reductase subunit C)